ncbi:MAG: alpha/beta hydrolase, partial [Streptosporangiales bacterium]|nr:alpha/beta hydrolase [Streptosporangiales bacterium]
MSIVTSGRDVAAETRAFNENLASTLASTPKVYEVDDAAALRKGSRGFPAPTLLEEAEERTVPGRGGDITIRVLVPPTVSGVFVYLHGGGFVLGSARNQDVRLWDLARAASVATVAVEYRLAPEHPHPAAVDDCTDVARWLADHAADEFGADEIVVGGESAGATLAVLTLLRLRDEAAHRRFRAAYLAYGPYDMSLTPSARAYGERDLVTSTQAERWFRAQAFPGRTGEELRDPAVSPLYADLRDLPRARFVVGSEDPLLDDTLFMVERWRAAGNEAALDVVAEAPHGFTAFPLKVAAREQFRLHDFVARALGHRPR